MSIGSKLPKCANSVYFEISQQGILVLYKIGVTHATRIQSLAGYELCYFRFKSRPICALAVMLKRTYKVTSRVLKCLAP